MILRDQASFIVAGALGQCCGGVLHPACQNGTVGVRLGRLAHASSALSQPDGRAYEDQKRIGPVAYTRPRTADALQRWSSQPPINRRIGSTTPGNFFFDATLAVGDDGGNTLWKPLQHTATTLTCAKTWHAKCPCIQGHLKKLPVLGQRRPL